MRRDGFLSIKKQEKKTWGNFAEVFELAHDAPCEDSDSRLD